MGFICWEWELCSYVFGTLGFATSGNGSCEGRGKMLEHDLLQVMFDSKFQRLPR